MFFFVFPLIFTPVDASNNSNVTVDELIIANTTAYLEINTTTSRPATTAQGALPEPIPVALSDLSSPSVHSRNIFLFLYLSQKRNI